MKDFLCKCNNCDTVMIDDNHKTDAKEIEVPENVEAMKYIHDNDGGFFGCPICLTDEYLSDYE